MVDWYLRWVDDLIVRSRGDHETSCEQQFNLIKDD